MIYAAVVLITTAYSIGCHAILGRSLFRTAPDYAKTVFFGIENGPIIRTAQWELPLFVREWWGNQVLS